MNNVDTTWPDEEEAETALVLHETRTPSRIEGGMAHFEQYLLLADRIAKTAMVPTALRGQPDQVLAVVMYGAELGIGPMQALQQINFIEGKPSMAPELMRALIREAGHKLNITQSNTECVIEGERGDTGEIGTASFSVQDAVDASLCKLVDGKVQARSSNGKRLPWESYTKDMLLARATSRIARMMFSDVIAGMSYTPEEVMSFTSPEPAAKPARARKASAPATTQRRAPAQEETQFASEETIAKLKDLLGLIDDDAKQEVRDTWKSLNIPSLAHGLTEEQAAQATKMVSDVLNIVDAEIVETSVPPVAADEGEQTGNSASSQAATNEQVNDLVALLETAGIPSPDRKTFVQEVIGRNIRGFTTLTVGDIEKIAAALGSRPSALIEENTLKRLQILFKDLDITDRGIRMQYITDAIGHPVETSKELTEQEARRIIAQIESELRESQPDPLDE